MLSVLYIMCVVNLILVYFLSWLLFTSLIIQERLRFVRYVIIFTCFTCSSRFICLLYYMQAMDICKTFCSLAFVYCVILFILRVLFRALVCDRLLYCCSQFVR